MKKTSKKNVINLLKNKKLYTYQEIASLTGYHPKSLIRINSQLKIKGYNIDKPKTINKNKIIEDYLKSNHQSYRAFYNSKLKNSISYSTLCKILQNAKTNKEIILIKKIKEKGKYYFIISDYKTNHILFTFNSLKNDKKSFKRIYYLILTKYGTPNYISFNNFFKDIPLESQNLLAKYNTKVLPFNSIYRKGFTPSNSPKAIKYKDIIIAKEDFYNFKTRTTIANNTIQFANTRWIINTNDKIKKNEKVTLFYNDVKEDLFIKYNNINYKLTLLKKVKSKKGNSKYS